MFLHRVGSDESHPGLMPLLRVYDSLAGYWSRSSRHRSSSATAHLPIWHADVRKFVVCRTNRASSGYRFRHIFPSLWIPDLLCVFLFRLSYIHADLSLAGVWSRSSMKRLEANENWTLFDPADVRGLTDLVGDAFVAAYERFERTGNATASLPARMLWDIVSGALRESGTPFLMYSDNINGTPLPGISFTVSLMSSVVARNNQSHLGIIKSANLCTEIVQYSSTIETAVCTLGAVCLPQFVRDDNTIDYDDLHRVTKIIVRNLDKLLDNGAYPTTESAVSAFGTRSIGVGVLGLADLFAQIEIPFTSQEAQDINVNISETVYHAALECSCELTEAHGPYDAWIGSPASKIGRAHV